MKILFLIFKMCVAIIIPISLVFTSLYFFDLDEKQRIIDNENYLTITTVESIDLEEFSDGYYYYKVMYECYRSDEYFILGEIIKTNDVFTPYEIGDKVEFYINDNNEIYTPSETLFAHFGVIFTIISLISFFVCLMAALFYIARIFQCILLLIKGKEIPNDMLYIFDK